MRRLALALLLAATLAGCSGGGDADNAAATAEPFATRWPVLLSHPWSNTADSSFHGDQMQDNGDFEAYGVKKLLEAGGAVVYQPDKLAYASHATRGQLLYRRCGGATVAAQLCETGGGEIVDGMHLAQADYCSDPALRERSGFADEAGCLEGLQFNIICHSQGCPDSRYMMAALDNAHSGKPMHRHVASWTSLAGANMGTELADWALEISAACLLPECRLAALGVVFGLDGLIQNGTIGLQEATESVAVLSRHYMLKSTDMRCDPATEDCPPAFNARYPLPEDPQHPIRYATYSMKIDDISHPCYRDNRLFHDVVSRRDGPNDGYIPVDSQAFRSYGVDGMGATPVIARQLDGTSNDPERPHPGLDHMAVSNSAVPGMPGVRCSGEDNSHLQFSREQVFADIVGELQQLGY